MVTADALQADVLRTSVEGIVPEAGHLWGQDAHEVCSLTQALQLEEAAAELVSPPVQWSPPVSVMAAGGVSCWPRPGGAACVCGALRDELGPGDRDLAGSHGPQGSATVKEGLASLRDKLSCMEERLPGLPWRHELQALADGTLRADRVARQKDAHGICQALEQAVADAGCEATASHEDIKGLACIIQGISAWRGSSARRWRARARRRSSGKPPTQPVHGSGRRHSAERSSSR